MRSKLASLVVVGLVGCAHGERTRLHALEGEGRAPTDLTLIEGGFELVWLGGRSTFLQGRAGACSRIEIVRSSQRGAPAQAEIRSTNEQVELCSREAGHWNAAVTQRGGRDGTVRVEAFDYEAHLQPEGVAVLRERAAWMVELPPGEAGAPLRAVPELIGAAIAMKLLPQERPGHVTIIHDE
ncbi:MAG: hypothetical protein JST92_12120 [Deltaproteobacteria bacterium]|nr:hypothetical protein [Deltaproteobacteria bacterium]